MKEDVKTELMHTDARMLLHMVTVPCSGASYSFWGEDSSPRLYYCSPEFLPSGRSALDSECCSFEY